MANEWKKTSETSMRLSPYTVAKISLNGALSYELWRDNEPLPIGRFKSFEDAKVFVRKEME